MKTVKKFSTHHDLKSFEDEPVDRAARLKKHAAFEQVIMEIKAIHNLQSARKKPKR